MFGTKQKTEQAATQDTWPEGVVARFLTGGGATVDLHIKRFTTKWDYRGAPYAAATPYEVNGWNWECLGCCAYGRERDTYNDPGYRDVLDARDAAQEHAERWRCMPRPA